MESIDCCTICNCLDTVHNSLLLLGSLEFYELHHLFFTKVLLLPNNKGNTKEVNAKIPLIWYINCYFSDFFLSHALFYSYYFSMYSKLFKLPLCYTFLCSTVYVRILFNSYITFHGSFGTLIFLNIKFGSHPRIYFLNLLLFIYTHCPSDFIGFMRHLYTDDFKSVSSPDCS